MDTSNQPGNAGYTTVDTELQHTAIIRATVPMAEIPQAQMGSRAKLAALLPTLNAGAPGLALTRFDPPADGQLAMEIGVIVGQAFNGSGEVEHSTLPAGRAAHFRLTGGFEGLGAAWGGLFAWCGQQGLALAGVNWEIYGEMSPDPAQQVTDLYTLLA